MQINFKFNSIANNLSVWEGHCMRNGGETQPGESFKNIPLEEYQKAGSGIVSSKGRKWEITPDRQP